MSVNVVSYSSAVIPIKLITLAVFSVIEDAAVFIKQEPDSEESSDTLEPGDHNIL